MNIKELSEDKLKALGFDEMKKLQIAQSNIMAIEQELARRQLNGKGNIHETVESNEMLS